MAGKAEIITNSAQLGLELGLSLAKTAEIYSQFSARQEISWELGSQVPEENPALVSRFSCIDQGNRI